MPPLNKQNILDGISSSNKNSKSSFQGKLIGDIDFAGETFEDVVDFTGSHFIGKVVFANAIFHEKVSFYDAIFNQTADFSGARFERGASFFSTTFHKSSNFSFCKFIENAYFWRARFHGKADFTQMIVFPSKDAEPSFIFPGEANFSWAWFMDKAKFTRAHFHGPVYFYRTIFHAESSFDEVLFKDRVLFNGDTTKVQISRFEFSTPKLLDALGQEENILLPDPEVNILILGKMHAVYFMFHEISSTQQLINKLNKLSKIKILPNQIAELKAIWEKGASKMFKMPDLVSFRETLFEKPDGVEFIDVNKKVKVHREKGEKESLETLVDALEIKPGIFGINLDLKKLFKGLSRLFRIRG